MIIYLLYLSGFLPSLVWLLFYLRKDSHPESNRMVIRVFLCGIFAGFLAIILEKGFQKTSAVLFGGLNSNSFFAIFFGGALIEEYVKYLAVRLSVFRSSEIDEPPDLLLYMIISALGFAALENILVLTNYHPILTSSKVLEVMSWRFISATLLHALSSGLFGYFLALSIFYSKKRKTLFWGGLILAALLHGLYNFSIMRVEGMEKLILPFFILLILAWFVSVGFTKLKRAKSVCLR